MPEGIASRLSTAISEKLNSAGIETVQIDFEQLQIRQVGALSRPAINISINQATYQKVTMSSYKATLIVTLYLFVANLRKERDRRFMILDLLEAIVDALLLEKLGLPLQDPLTPQSFDNVTDLTSAGAGQQIYQLKFSCSHNFTKVPDSEKDLGRLKKIVVDYFLHPNDDGIKDASSEISLTGVDGGDAYSEYGRQVDGGSAGSKHKDKYDGGDARSVY